MISVSLNPYGEDVEDGEDGKDDDEDDGDFSDEEAVNSNDRPVSMVFTGPVHATLITVL